MSTSTLWLFVIILIVYLTLVLSGEVLRPEQSGTLQSFGSSDLEDEARTRKYRHKLWYLWGWHALAIAYWVKVKLIVVGFFVGSAVFVALRYVWPNKCASGIVHDSPTIVYDHPPPSFAHDHVPYSLDHSPHFDHPFSSSDSVDPYSAYAGSYAEDITATAEVIPSTAEGTHRVGRRSAHQQTEHLMKTEERIAEFMFEFLGLDSRACRRRFICEMEFRSRSSPLSSMAFRIVGRGFFEKYMNIRNELGQAHSFAECAAVNPECVFIEQNVEDDTASQSQNTVELQSDTVKAANEMDNSSTEIQNSANDVIMHLENQNEANLHAERRHIKQIQNNNWKYNSVTARLLKQGRLN
ncbi:uncharacterized protein LOC128866465 [Anastrepha ludens]|uniref:uncharacterized protein LOC128866465 n=1 Tax=Anastrepha ludens TaxID=28586 RepID=UPI0023B15EBD|nr:uncharacterized protein LOC128866465 [Anastrepha ludens]